MSNLEFKTVILEWFQTVKACGLILPDGWFGRPYDNLHRLTFIEARPHKLLLELDHQLWLILTDVSKVYTDNSELILEDFAQCVFDWQAYGSLSPQVKVYKSGVVKLVPPLAA
jgi:hypothetical protein